jgi:hypothetical protein
MKKCYKCGRTLPTSAFAMEGLKTGEPGRKRGDGLSSKCNDCLAALGGQHRADWNERRRARRAAGEIDGDGRRIPREEH